MKKTLMFRAVLLENRSKQDPWGRKGGLCPLVSSVTHIVGSLEALALEVTKKCICLTIGQYEFRYTFYEDMV